MQQYSVIRVNRTGKGQYCKVLDTFNTFEDAYSFLSKMNNLYKTDSLIFVIDKY